MDSIQAKKGSYKLAKPKFLVSEDGLLKWLSCCGRRIEHNVIL